MGAGGRGRGRGGRGGAPPPTPTLPAASFLSSASLGAFPIHSARALARALASSADGMGFGAAFVPAALAGLPGMMGTVPVPSSSSAATRAIAASQIAKPIEPNPKTRGRAKKAGQVVNRGHVQPPAVEVSSQSSPRGPRNLLDSPATAPNPETRENQQRSSSAPQADGRGHVPPTVEVYSQSSLRGPTNHNGKNIKSLKAAQLVKQAHQIKCGFHGMMQKYAPGVYGDGVRLKGERCVAKLGYL